jgi:hypothetical protein
MDGETPQNPKSSSQLRLRQQQRAARLSVQPGGFTRVFVRRPKLICSVVILVPLLALAFIIALKEYDFNSIDTRDYLVRTDLRTLQDDAQEAAVEQYAPDTRVFFASTAGAVTPDPARSRASDKFQLQAIFRAREPSTGKLFKYVSDASVAPSVLTRERIAEVKRLEDEFVATKRFSEYCWFDETAKDCDGKVPVCAPYQSITLHPKLYGKYDKTGKLCGVEKGSALKSTAEFDAFLSSLVNKSTSSVDQDFAALLGTETAQTGRSFVARSVYKFGLPYSASVEDGSYASWVTPAIADNQALAKSADLSPLYVTYIGEDYNNKLFTDIALKDLAFAGGSVCFKRHKTDWLKTVVSRLRSLTFNLLVSLSLFFLLLAISRLQ